MTFRPYLSTKNGTTITPNKHPNGKAAPIKFLAKVVKLYFCLRSSEHGEFHPRQHPKQNPPRHAITFHRELIMATIVNGLYNESMNEKYKHNSKRGKKINKKRKKKEGKKKPVTAAPYCQRLLIKSVILFTFQAFVN